MKCLVDTNILSTIFLKNSLSKKKKLEYKFINKKFDIVHNSISLVEFGRGIDSTETILSEIKKLLTNSDTLIPSLVAWKTSLNLINELYHLKYSITKFHLRKMQMDALLAGVTLEHKLVILSNDSDFQTLKSLKSGKSLVIYRPGFN